MNKICLYPSDLILAMIVCVILGMCIGAIIIAIGMSKSSLKKAEQECDCIDYGKV